MNRKRWLLGFLIAVLLLISQAVPAVKVQLMARAQGNGLLYLPLVQHGLVPLIPAFERTPPRPEEASIERLADPVKEGDTLLKVKFLPDQDLPVLFSIQLEQGQVLLRDDGQGPDQEKGDGLYSAIIRLSVDELEQLNRHLETWIPESPVVPVFDQRQVVGEARLEPLDLQAFLERSPTKIFPFPIGIPAAVDSERTLVVRHPSVVESKARTFNPCTGAGTPMGPWTFGRLMTDLANQPLTGINPSDFVRRWLAEWEVHQTVNGDLSPARLNIRNLVIDPWQAASGGPGAPLDLSISPFRLLAIVNRVDLRGNAVYGGNAGEGRFVFEPLDVKNNCQPLPFTIIFEYGIPKQGCFAVRNWAKQWLDLQNHPLGSPAYLAALQAITDQFAAPGLNPKKPPNNSALNQLRTNEIALAAPWDLREFVIHSTTGLLEQVTVKQTPAFAFNNTDTLASYVNSEAASILIGAHTVPDDFPLPGMPFLGAAAPTPFGLFWDGAISPPGLDIAIPDARHMFSLNTCNGCHAGETDTAFTHIGIAPFGSPAPLSGFMTGINVADPADGAPIRHFDDLARRAADLDALANSSCIFHLFHIPLLMVH